MIKSKITCKILLLQLLVAAGISFNSCAPKKDLAIRDMVLIYEGGAHRNVKWEKDHFAHMHHVEIGYTFKVRATPRLVVQYDYASGTRSPGGSQNGSGGSQRQRPCFSIRPLLGPLLGPLLRPLLRLGRRVVPGLGARGRGRRGRSARRRGLRIRDLHRQRQEGEPQSGRAGALSEV